MRRLLRWLACPSLIWSLRFEDCCYGRPLFWARSWELRIVPRPVPQFNAWHSNAEFVVEAGWFILRVRKPKYMGARYFRRSFVACLSRMRYLRGEA